MRSKKLLALAAGLGLAASVAIAAGGGGGAGGGGRGGAGRGGPRGIIGTVEKLDGNTLTLTTFAFGRGGGGGGGGQQQTQTVTLNDATQIIELGTPDTNKDYQPGAVVMAAADGAQGNKVNTRALLVYKPVANDDELKAANKLLTSLQPMVQMMLRRGGPGGGGPGGGGPNAQQPQIQFGVGKIDTVKPFVIKTVEGNTYELVLANDTQYTKVDDCKREDLTQGKFAIITPVEGGDANNPVAALITLRQPRQGGPGGGGGRGGRGGGRGGNGGGGGGNNGNQAGA